MGCVSLFKMRLTKMSRISSSSIIFLHFKIDTFQYLAINLHCFLTKFVELGVPMQLWNIIHNIFLLSTNHYWLQQCSQFLYIPSNLTILCVLTDKCFFARECFMVNHS